MIIAVLVLLGLCLGSFVNALVWRIHEQALKRSEVSGQRSAGQKPKSASAAVDHRPPTTDHLSILRGRSMCPHCRHELATRDLIPVLSWLSLRGKCRYCEESVSVQYPLVEVMTALLFTASYVWWPLPLHGAVIALFGLWLLLLVGFMALIVYDLRWFLLPNRIVYPLATIALVYAAVSIAAASRPLTAVGLTALAVLVGGGIFYLLFQLSGGKWIGGGDVRLGWLLGLVVGTPARSLLVIFIAALSGSLVSLPLMVTGRLKRTSIIPFGPFLIIAAIIVQLFGADILHWYQTTLLAASG